MNNNIKNVVIVLPTYNERENIKNIINAILNQKYYLPKYNLAVLVVDDYSPDGTGRIVRKLSKQNSSIKIITGKKEGLGAAYIRGFNNAITLMDADILFEMDADFSHNPNDIPRFVKKIEEGYDFVIGSRYITGGNLAKDWSFLRKLNSKVGNIFARYIAGLYSVKDCTSGFRAIKVDALRNIYFDNLDTKGYVFQVSLLSAILKSESKVIEIPIHFKERMYGKSKMSINDIIEFLIMTIKLRFKSNTHIANKKVLNNAFIDFIHH
jgi:dolichol-phosphate mannosyltransferase